MLLLVKMYTVSGIHAVVPLYAVKDDESLITKALLYTCQ